MEHKDKNNGVTNYQLHQTNKACDTPHNKLIENSHMRQIDWKIMLCILLSC